MTEAINTASKDARNVSGIPIVAKNQVHWDFIDYTTSKTNAENIYTGSNLKSGLLTGKMWDTTMKWLENTGVNVQTDSREWGNYIDATVMVITEYSTNKGANWTSASSKPNGNSYLLKSGNSEFTKKNNIYDLAGNMQEWTTELLSDVSVLRGADYYMKGLSLPAACRIPANSAEYLGNSLGFRVALYIQ